MCHLSQTTHVRGEIAIGIGDYFSFTKDRMSRDVHSSEEEGEEEGERRNIG